MRPRCGSAPLRRNSERRRGWIWPHSSGGRIERFDPLHVLVIELEIERADVLLHPLGPNRLRNDDQAAVEMPPDDDLRRRPFMFGGDLNQRRFAQQAASSQRAPGFRFDAMLVVKRPEGILLKTRMKL